MLKVDLVLTQISLKLKSIVIEQVIMVISISFSFLTLFSDVKASSTV